ncbi:hypothetical protein QJS10_CPB14g00196 [Acorus calamus]|uniref:Uncharacterized protein n=1 Tax=Acorus calamus TaxID=4465 RepID=A0AAV9DGM7_ACOCL|nr:hypothetical protein QJS10_CPB14g00196 [Acorus calamus]
MERRRRLMDLTFAFGGGRGPEEVLLRLYVQQWGQEPVTPGDLQRTGFLSELSVIDETYGSSFINDE